MGINHEKRAYLAWAALVKQAEDKKTITYIDLAQKVGVHQRAAKFFLEPIQEYCLKAKLPPLTILVVNKSGGKPGQGFIAWDVDNLDQGIKSVFDFNWFAIDNPFSYATTGETLEDLAQDLINSTNSAEVYAKIRVRGMAQDVFRSALIKVYGGRCAFCGLNIVEVLEASHIIPWSRASEKERLDVRNGMLLCCTHHKLFDKRLLYVDENYKIKCSSQLLIRIKDTDNKKQYEKLNEKLIELPKDCKHWPDVSYLSNSMKSASR